MAQSFAEITDEELNDAFIRVKDKFSGYDDVRERFFDVRDKITDIVKACADNVEVVIYANDILDKPIKVKAGNGENRLRITIKSGGRVSIGWTKETWGKVFNDVWNGISSLLRSILTCFVSKAKDLLAIDDQALPAIKNEKELLWK